MYLHTVCVFDVVVLDVVVDIKQFLSKRLERQVMKVRNAKEPHQSKKARPFFLAKLLQVTSPVPLLRPHF
jgi:hypothetical protein